MKEEIVDFYKSKANSQNYSCFESSKEVSLLYNSPWKQQNLPFYLYGSCCINCESNTGQTAPTQQPKTELLLTNVGCCLLGEMKLVLLCLCYTSQWICCFIGKPPYLYLTCLMSMLGRKEPLIRLGKAHSIINPNTCSSPLSCVLLYYRIVQMQWERAVY